jgi:hypothetical protein
MPRAAILSATYELANLIVRIYKKKSMPSKGLKGREKSMRFISFSVLVLFFVFRSEAFSELNQPVPPPPVPPGPTIPLPPPVPALDFDEFCKSHAGTYQDAEKKFVMTLSEKCQIFTTWGYTGKGYGISERQTSLYRFNNLKTDRNVFGERFDRGFPEVATAIYIWRGDLVGPSGCWAFGGAIFHGCFPGDYFGPPTTCTDPDQSFSLSEDSDDISAHRLLAVIHGATGVTGCEFTSHYKGQGTPLYGGTQAIRMYSVEH